MCGALVPCPPLTPPRRPPPFPPNTVARSPEIRYDRHCLPRDTMPRSRLSAPPRPRPRLRRGRDCASILSAASSPPSSEPPSPALLGAPSGSTWAASASVPEASADAAATYTTASSLDIDDNEEEDGSASTPPEICCCHSHTTLAREIYVQVDGLVGEISLSTLRGRGAGPLSGPMRRTRARSTAAPSFAPSGRGWAGTGIRYGSIDPLQGRCKRLGPATETKPRKRRPSWCRASRPSPTTCPPSPRARR
jgi:hypothetical protein